MIKMTEDNECNIRLIYSTTSNEEEAQKIGDNLVTNRLVACVNIIPGMKSIYHWQGKIEHDDECIMLAKTTSDNTEEVISRIKELHSYDLPCIVVVPIISGLPDYLKWIGDETHAKAEDS
jgi:periplasmic divalent cation tolerance protein